MKTPKHIAWLLAISALPSTAFPASFEYDANGNLTRITDPLGRTTSKQYDAYNRLVRVQLPAPVTGASIPVLSYTYDSLDQLTSVTDPRNLKTSYTVDGLANQLTLSSPDTRITSRTFDAIGNLVSSKDARGQLTTYTYDAGNRLIRITYAGGIATTFAYGAALTGAAGRLVNMTDESGETSYSYDAVGRLLTKVQTVRNDAQSRQFQVSYSYGQGGTSLGKVDSITYPSGNRVLFEYGNDGSVSSIQVGQASSNATTVLIRDISYLPMGLPEFWLWGSGHAYQRAFDLQGRLLRFPLGEETQGGVIRTLEYDAAGNITAARHTQAGKPVAALDQYFAYDGLDRLTAFHSATTTQSFRYDPSGNRAQLSVGSRTYTNRVDAASNRLLSTDGPLPAKAYAYDAAGNVTSDGTVNFHYSARARLESIQNGSIKTHYVYNGANERVLKTGSRTLHFSGASYFVYDESHRLLGEYDADGSPINEIVYLDGLPVGVIKRNGIYYVYTDQIGAPRVISNPTDNRMVWRWDQSDPFGMLPPSENLSGPFIFNERFPGQHYDQETNLHYNYFRDYDPQLGRYIESDPIGLAGGINTYGYVFGNPTANADPKGLFVPIVIAGVCSGGGCEAAAALAGAAALWWAANHPAQASNDNRAPGGIIPPQNFPGGISWPPKNEPQQCRIDVPPPKLPPAQKPDCDTVFNVCRATVAQSGAGIISRAAGYVSCLTGYAICKKVIGGDHQ